MEAAIDLVAAKHADCPPSNPVPLLGLGPRIVLGSGEFKWEGRCIPWCVLPDISEACRYIDPWEGRFGGYLYAVAFPGAEVVKFGRCMRCPAQRLYAYRKSVTFPKAFSKYAPGKFLPGESYVLALTPVVGAQHGDELSMLNAVRHWNECVHGSCGTIGESGRSEWFLEWSGTLDMVRAIRRAMTRFWETGEPWRTPDSLDVHDWIFPGPLGSSDAV